MCEPNYLKCFVELTNPLFTAMLLVSGQLAYAASSLNVLALGDSMRGFSVSAYGCGDGFVGELEMFVWFVSKNPGGG